MSDFYDMGEEGLDDAVEPTPVPAGEYRVKIIDWMTDDEGNVIRLDTNDAPFILPKLSVIDCEGADYAPDFTYFLRMPNDEQTAKEKNKSKFNLRAFFQAFDLNYGGRIEWEEAIGAEADALLGIEHDTGFGEKNRVEQFIAPK